MKDLIVKYYKQVLIFLAGMLSNALVDVAGVVKEFLSALAR